MRWWAVIVLPIAALLIAGLWDWRWAIVALALVLILVPAVQMFVYFNYALRPDSQYSMILHYVIIDTDGITVVPIAKMKPWKIGYEDIRNCEDTGESLLLWIRSPKYAHIEIPFDKLNSIDDATEILSIYSKEPLP